MFDVDKKKRKPTVLLKALRLNAACSTWNVRFTSSTCITLLQALRQFYNYRCQLVLFIHTVHRRIHRTHSILHTTATHSWKPFQQVQRCRCKWLLQYEHESTPTFTVTLPFESSFSGWFRLCSHCKLTSAHSSWKETDWDTFWCLVAVIWCHLGSNSTIFTGAH